MKCEQPLLKEATSYPRAGFKKVQEDTMNAQKLSSTPEPWKVPVSRGNATTRNHEWAPAQPQPHFAPSKGSAVHQHKLTSDLTCTPIVNNGVAINIWGGFEALESLSRATRQLHTSGSCSQTLPPSSDPDKAAPAREREKELGKGDILKGSKGKRSILGSSSLVPSRVFIEMPC